MKKLITATVFLLASKIAFAQTTKRVLFLGNSYTYVNNLPQIIADVSASVGDTLIFDSNTPGGYTLQGHSTNTTSLNKIMLGDYDFVVLQEQSQLPSFPDFQVQSDVFPYASFLDSVINRYNPCGETMFYMTWGRKNGDASNCPIWSPVCTYAGMDSLLYLRYMMMADSNNAVVSPVGAVWKYIRQNYPLIDLYQSDESHPSPAGSYAAACCFYTSMFRKNPLLITNNYILSATDAANIRSVVKTIVYDSLLKWHIGEYDPIANFDFTATSNSVTFNNLSTNAISYKWDFGDGDTSITFNPEHTYATIGNYMVTLIAYYCNFSDTITQAINISGTTGLNGVLKPNNKIKLYPNPFTTSTTLSYSNKVLSKASIIIYDSYGNIVKQFNNLNGQKVLLSRDNLPSGIYFIRLVENDNVSGFTKALITD
jgi:PKD repeat protein